MRKEKNIKRNQKLRSQKNLNQRRNNQNDIQRLRKDF